MKNNSTKKNKKPTTAKKIVVAILWILAGTIAFVLLWMAAAFLLPKITVNNDFTSCTGENCITMYLRSNGMHTDMVFPVVSAEKDWRTQFPIDIYEGVDSSFNYISIGWGDKGFYLDTPTWAELKVSTAFKAAFGVSGTAMHITYLANPPSTTGEYGQHLDISAAQYHRLMEYIDKAMVKDASGKVILIPHPDYDINDNYYEAYGSYSVFKTCNVWTSRCLKQAGLQSGLWTPTASGVISSSQY